MSERGGARRRRVGVLAVTVLVVVGIGALVARRVWFHDRARAVGLDEAIDQFRDETAASSTVLAGPVPTTVAVGPSAPAPTTSTVPPVVLPPIGVYRYATTGQESVDILGGATHDYPAETTITVTAAGCGVHLRWDALAERRDEWDLCAEPDGVAWGRSGVQFHEFYGQADAEAIACDTAVLVVPPTAPTAAGPTTTQTCTLASSPWSAQWQVLGSERRAVGGRTLVVTHVREVVDLDVDDYEHTTTDWYLAPDGLPVEVSSDKASRSPSPIGPVTYAERFHLVLQSLVPLR